MENKIKEILLEKIKDQNVYFVFPTQVSCSRWADYLVVNSSHKAVSMERFIPWDDFKSSAIRGTQKDKKSVPSVMRRFFASDLLSQNAASPFLKELVSPKYSKNSAGFVNWLSGIIPALSMWKKFFDNSGLEKDAEDQDYMEIYSRYQAFLDKYNLFDPAWETPPFSNDGKKYIIFYPEILSDWFEYESILRSSSDITIVNYSDAMGGGQCAFFGQESLQEENISTEAESFASENQSASLEKETSFSPVFTFPDSRSEINAAVRYIRLVHEKENIPWDQIALSIPDMESYGPYVCRELELFEIPYVSKYAMSLSSYAAGSLFSCIREVYSSNFSFESVKKLLLNLELPWKERESIDQLLEFGRNNNCIVNISEGEKKVDVWEKSFAKSSIEERARLFYSKLKECVTGLVLSRDFFDLRKHYFTFRDTFFDMEACSEKSDKILSRCITELSTLIEMEKTFSECKVSSPLGFFISYLDEKSYLSQNENLGIQVIPYKLSATAPFSLQLVLDASQASMSVIYRSLSFLREDKRRKILNVDDVNAGDTFVRLYMANSLCKKAWFSSAAKTFTGYAQPVSMLEEKAFSDLLSKKEALSESGLQSDPGLEKNTGTSAFLSEDFYKEEKKWFMEEGSFPERITRLSKDSSDRWISLLPFSQGGLSESASELKEFKKQKSYSITKKNGKCRVSYSQLKKFLFCPKNYFLSSVAKIKESVNEAEFIDKWEKGTLNHLIFECFFLALKKRDMALSLDISTGKPAFSKEYEDLFHRAVNEAVESESQNLSFMAQTVLSVMTSSLLENMREVLLDFSEKFLGYKVFAVEAEYKVEREDYIAEGKIDVILTSPTSGDLVVVDFKTSTIPSNLYFDQEDFSKNHEYPDFQMPMYFFLLENQKSPLHVDAACYYTIRDKKLYMVCGDGEGLKKNKNTQDLAEYSQTQEKFLECMENFAHALKEADFSLDEEKFLWSNCNNCDYRAVCRRVFNVGRGR